MFSINFNYRIGPDDEDVVCVHIDTENGRPAAQELEDALKALKDLELDYKKRAAL